MSVAARLCHSAQPIAFVAVPEPALDVRRCWICSAIVARDEPTIAPTVCARCYEALVSSWR
jgi:hypothetical protein